MSNNNITYDGSNLSSHIETFEQEDIVLFNSDDEINDYENEEDDEENEDTLAYG